MERVKLFDSKFLCEFIDNIANDIVEFSFDFIGNVLEGAADERSDGCGFRGSC